MFVDVPLVMRLFVDVDVEFTFALVVMTDGLEEMNVTAWLLPSADVVDVLDEPLAVALCAITPMGDNSIAMVSSFFISTPSHAGRAVNPPHL